MISSALKTGGQAAYMQDSLKFHRKRNSHLKGEQKMSGVACKIKLQQNQQEHHLVLLEPSAKTELKPGVRKDLIKILEKKICVVLLYVNN